MKRSISLILIALMCCFAASAFADTWICSHDQTGNSWGYCMQCGSLRDEACQIAVGQYVYYGHYMQSAAGDDSTPIEWMVLDVADGRIQLISRYILDCVPYIEENFSMTDEESEPEERDPSASLWSRSTLREWLQNDFVTAAFTADEASHILLTEVKNNWEEYNGPVANTMDTVYLLSTKEAETHLVCMSWEKSFDYDWNEALYYSMPATTLLNAGTPYMISKFWNRISDPDEWQYLSDIAWWARDTAHDSYPYAFNWFIYEQDFDFLSYGVRPVMWVDLSAPYTLK